MIDSNLIVPDIDWARARGKDLGLPPRCPFASVNRCPRYYQSLSLLGRHGGSTAIPEDEDERLLDEWKDHELWPSTLEQTPAVSGPSQGPKSFTNFCPEVLYDRFGYFAESLFPFSDEIDQDMAIKYWSGRPVPRGHWGFDWSSLQELHYTDCPMYALLTAEPPPTAGRQRKEEDAVTSGLIRKIAVLAKDHLVIREIDDLFIFAGADATWWLEPDLKSQSERMHRVYGWVAGVRAHAPDQASEIIIGVAAQLAEKESIPEGDRTFLRQRGHIASAGPDVASGKGPAEMPSTVERLLDTLIRGVPRAMTPLRHRRKGSSAIAFSDEYDLQDLVHALLKPWIKDIRPEEYTPSYAGKSSRTDFLLPEHRMVLEAKFVRDRRHGKDVGDELILDVAHYGAHPACDHLWAVVYDPHGFVTNPEGLSSDLEGPHQGTNGTVNVRVYVLQP